MKNEQNITSERFGLFYPLQYVSVRGGRNGALMKTLFESNAQQN